MPVIAGHHVPRDEAQLRCPCCHQLRRPAEYQTFAAQLSILRPLTNVSWHTGAVLGNAYWMAAKRERAGLQWACDECLDADRATAGRILHQDSGAYEAPHFAYYDQVKTCRDCGNPFTFSRDEQRHWYETLHFRVDVTRIRCRACTRRKHQQAHLSRLLIERDYTDLNRTRQIIDLYVQFGQFEAAKRYLALSRHAFSATSPEYRLLTEWRNEVKTREQAPPDLS